MKGLKRTLIALFLTFLPSVLFARVSVICDVIYEKSFAEWSDYYRCEVEFISGAEMNRPLESNTLYAVIWFSQTNCAIISMNHKKFIVGKIDLEYVYYYFLFEDILNEGLLGIQVNSKEEVNWRIYGKDNLGIMIDPIFSRQYPSNVTEKERIEKIKRGAEEGRQRPADERFFAGMDKAVYIAGAEGYHIFITKHGYAILETIPYHHSTNIEKGELAFGTIRVGSVTQLTTTYRYTSPIEYKVRFIDNDYDNCARWIIKEVENSQ